eukprot:10564421-Lingulodinium_polyedra.AAC.1
MRDTWAAFEVAKQSTNALVAKVVKRSCMQHSLVKTMFEHARQVSFEHVSADMMDLARNMFRLSFGQTKVCEDALHPCRQAEEHQQRSKQ